MEGRKEEKTMFRFGPWRGALEANTKMTMDYLILKLHIQPRDLRSSWSQCFAQMLTSMVFKVSMNDKTLDGRNRKKERRYKGKKKNLELLGQIL